MNRQRFAEIIYQQALECAKKSNINPIIVAAQACLQTGYGQSILCRRANNLFGIESSKSWKGLAYPIKTRRFDINLGWIATNVNFRQYPNWVECMNDYSSIIESIDNYRVSIENYADPIKFLDGIMPTNIEHNSVTDPHYRDKILSIAKKWKWL